MRIDQSRVVGNLNDNQQPNSSSIEAELQVDRGSLVYWAQ